VVFQNSSCKYTAKNFVKPCTLSKLQETFAFLCESCAEVLSKLWSLSVRLSLSFYRRASFCWHIYRVRSIRMCKRIRENFQTWLFPVQEHQKTLKELIHNPKSNNQIRKRRTSEGQNLNSEKLQHVLWKGTSMHPHVAAIHARSFQNCHSEDGQRLLKLHFASKLSSLNTTLRRHRTAQIVKSMEWTVR
jgi:4-hydroxy-3-methylbut-2-enyl diphosphate reductase IspH